MQYQVFLALAGIAAASKWPAAWPKVLLTQATDCPNSTDPDCLSDSNWTHFNANYDDLPSNDVIGAYDNAVYSGFTVATPLRIDDHPPTNHLRASTWPNSLRAPAYNETFQPTILAQPSQFVKVKWFDFGCYTYDPSPNAPPENRIVAPCNVTVQSVVDGFAAPATTFEYVPYGWYAGGMALANLTANDGDFLAESIGFYAQGASGDPMILYIDTLVGVNYTLT